MEEYVIRWERVNGEGESRYLNREAVQMLLEDLLDDIEEGEVARVEVYIRQEDM